MSDVQQLLMANTTVSVANVPDELIRDILKMYSEHFEELKSQNMNDSSALMQGYANYWDEDVSYGDFNMARIDGPFLSRIVLTQRAKFRKVYNIRHTGSGFAAACAKNIVVINIHCSVNIDCCLQVCSINCTNFKEQIK